MLCITVYSIDINISAPPGEGRGDHVWVGEVVAEDEEAGVPRLVRHDYDILYSTLFTLHFTVYALSLCFYSGMLGSPLRSSLTTDTGLGMIRGGGPEPTPPTPHQLPGGPSLLATWGGRGLSSSGGVVRGHG